MLPSREKQGVDKAGPSRAVNPRQCGHEPHFFNCSLELAQEHYNTNKGSRSRSEHWNLNTNEMLGSSVQLGGLATLWAALCDRRCWRKFRRKSKLPCIIPSLDVSTSWVTWKTSLCSGHTMWVPETHYQRANCGLISIFYWSCSHAFIASSCLFNNRAHFKPQQL